MSTNKKALFFDIDGTILSEVTGKIPESASAALQKAHDLGHLLFINTGRTICCLPPMICRLPFSGYLCGCGSYIVYNDEVLTSTQIPKERQAEIIRQVKEAVSIPVIGNGDVTSGEKAIAMREQTGCDGVMIARGAQGNPWIFSELLEYERTGRLPDRPDVEEIKQTMLRHARLQIEYKGDFTGIREMRKHVAWYTKGLHGAARLRDQINQVESYAELENLLTSL